MTSGSAPTTITAPAGWTQTTESVNAGVRTRVFTRTAAAGDPGSWAFTLSASQKAAGVISAYSGVDTASPIDVSGVGTNASGTAHVAPSVSTTGNNRLMMVVSTIATSTTATAPAGSTERGNVRRTPARRP